VDNNVYTNLMAQRNLLEAADACDRNPDGARALEVTAEEVTSWRSAADKMLIPYDDDLGVHPQAEGFTEHLDWDFANTPEEKYPLLLNYPYFDIYRKQVVKQADLVLAMFLRGDAFTPEQKLRNFDYYEARTVRDSSLSACTQAVLAAEVGHLTLAYDYLAEAALTDLHDLHNNVRNGLHMASLAGAWSSAVSGFGGMRDYGGTLSFAPRLPSALSRMTFRMVYRGAHFKVSVSRTEATYELLSGVELETTHHGETLTIGEKPVSLAIPEIEERARPAQPPGREPIRRVPVE
jgi:alpha,alpha-trehalose phosphorylase